MPFVQLATDDFNRANSSPTLSGNWGTVSGINGLDIVTHTVRINAINQQSIQFYNGLVWPNDQYSSVKYISSSASGTQSGVVVRQSASAKTCYLATYQIGGGMIMGKFVAGTFTLLGSSPSTIPNSGDLISLSAVGTTITLTLAGVQLAQATDSSITSGNAGLFMVSNAQANAILSTWAGGDFVPTPAPTSASPLGGKAGATLNVTVSGSNFDSGGTSTLSFSGTGITINSYGTRNSTTLTANITISSSASLTARDITVTNSSGQTGTLSSGFIVLAGVYSVPDCRNYATFPNASRVVNGTITYDVQTSSNSAAPSKDCRAAGSPVASGTYPQNSRTPGTFGPGE